MNCFEHLQKPAVGICANCGRGLCRECATVVENTLSCRGGCEHEVLRKRQLMAKSEQAYAEKTILFGNSAKTYQESFASTAVFGLIASVIAAVGLFNGQEVLSVILFGIAAFFLFRSAGLYRSGKKFRELADNQAIGQNK